MGNAELLKTLLSSRGKVDGWKHPSTNKLIELSYPRIRVSGHRRSAQFSDRISQSLHKTPSKPDWSYTIHKRGQFQGTGHWELKAVIECITIILFRLPANSALSVASTSHSLSKLFDSLTSLSNMASITTPSDCFRILDVDIDDTGNLDFWSKAKDHALKKSSQWVNRPHHAAGRKLLGKPQSKM